MAREHGTRAMYREGRCRCARCRAWNAAAKRVYDAQFKEREGISVTQKYRAAQRRKTPALCSKCGADLLAILAEPLCAPCRGNRPGYNIRISPVQRLAIYSRDGWTCQICTELVDPTAPTNSTWDATLDHIVPRTKGGTDDPANLRLAHRWCNSVRGDLSHHIDDDLRVA